MRNLSDPRQVRRREKKTRQDRKKDLLDLRQLLLSSHVFRRFYFELLAPMQRTSFTGTSETFFLEGERNVALRLWADLNEAAPEAYLMMLQEQKAAHVAERQAEEDVPEEAVAQQESEYDQA